VSERVRRFFWGNSLAQAVMSAARFHRIDPETLAFRIHEKRHGFVKHPRAVVIEVDPVQPRRAPGETPSAPVAAPQSRAATPKASAPRPGRPARERPAEREAPRRRERSATEGHGGTAEAWDPPDAESEVAALEAVRRLLQFAGIAVEPEVRVAEGRLEILLAGAEESKVVARGVAFLEELEHLLPRAIHGLSGRMVRCRIDCGGLREGHDRELRELAEREAERAIASGEPVLLEPLSSAERRVVHLALHERTDVSTESLGSGARKRIRIAPV